MSSIHFVTRTITNIFFLPLNNHKIKVINKCSWIFLAKNDCSKDVGMCLFKLKFKQMHKKLYIYIRRGFIHGPTKLVYVIVSFLHKFVLQKANIIYNHDRLVNQ